jgi:arylsulfate sulfotransferase
MKTRQMMLIGAVLCVVCFAIGCSSSGSKSSTPPPPPPPPPAVTISISPDKTAIATGGVTTLQVTLTNDTAVTWAVDDVANGDASVGTIATQNLQGTYTAPAGQTGLVATVTATSVADTTKSASATVYVVPPGTVTATPTTLVAAYSIMPPSEAAVSVQFGLDTTYGRATSVTETPQGGGAVNTFVAGMTATTLYHMQAIVNFADGTQYLDADQTFTTGVIPANHLTTTRTATTTPGTTPQPGIELLDLITGGADATDLDGNIIWYYNGPAVGGTILQPIRPLRNGHFLLVLAPNSSVPLTGPAPTPATTDEIREIDLAGNTIQSLNVTDLNTKLVNAGFSLNAQIIHHDIIETPNGHWIVFVNSLQNFTNLTGLPGVTTVLGDAIVDLDANLNPVWVWNSFDHLDINRHPFSFPDWTHANALLYTSDGDLLVSLRHQNWILKIDYKNGKGTGDILWHLGQGGDFTLVGGTDPTDWSYAQHGPAFFGPASAHIFNLGVMDNGDDRAFPSNETCTQAGFTVCPFTTVPIYQIDETAMTATLTFHDVLSQFNSFGGNVASLANGNVEFDLCSDTTPTPQPGASVSEVTQVASPQVVWKMSVAGDNAYRMFRMGSLYPGVQW